MGQSYPLQKDEVVGVDLDGGHEEVGDGDQKAAAARAAALEQAALITVERAAHDTHLTSDHVGCEFLGTEIFGGFDGAYGKHESIHLTVGDGHRTTVAAAHITVLQGGNADKKVVGGLTGGVDEDKVGNVGISLAHADAAPLHHPLPQRSIRLHPQFRQLTVGGGQGVGALEVAHHKPVLVSIHSILIVLDFLSFFLSYLELQDILSIPAQMRNLRKIKQLSVFLKSVAAHTPTRKPLSSKMIWSTVILCCCGEMPMLTASGNRPHTENADVQALYSILQR